MAEPISLTRLSLALIPVAVFLIWLVRAGRPTWPSLQALARMLLQLSLIGYVLVFIFDTQRATVTLATLTVMLLAASIIAIRSRRPHSWRCLSHVVIAILVGGGLTLAVMIVGVLNLQPWYQPRVLIPLAGMTFSNCMNAISLALSQLEKSGDDHEQAVQGAIDVALIPITNSLMAVGVVSIPGMMTGQVLAGVSPLIAARYQVMVMCMVFASAGLSLMVFLQLQKRNP